MQIAETLDSAQCVHAAPSKRRSLVAACLAQRAPRRLHRWALSDPAGLAGAVRPLLRRSGRRPRPLLWSHGRPASARHPAGADSFAACRAGPVHPRRRDGLCRDGVAAGLRRPLRRSRVGGSRVQHSASSRLAPRHGDIRPGSPPPARHLQFLRRSRQGDSPCHRGPVVADPRLAFRGRPDGALRFRGRLRPRDTGPADDLALTPVKHRRARTRPLRVRSAHDNRRLRYGDPHGLFAVSAFPDRSPRGNITRRRPGPRAALHRRRWAKRPAPGSASIWASSAASSRRRPPPRS